MLYCINKYFSIIYNILFITILIFVHKNDMIRYYIVNIVRAPFASPPLFTIFLYLKKAFFRNRNFLLVVDFQSLIISFVYELKIGTLLNMCLLL